MGTFKRTPFEIDTTVRNGSKYLNQMQFNGIVQNNNTYDVDQNSLTDALNVYVNEQNTLVSREPLIIEQVPGLNSTDKLVDIKTIKDVTIYVVENNDKYSVIARYDNFNYSLTNITKYQITIFDQYIICFNDKGAKVINLNNKNGWQSLQNYIEIPVTKITTGSVTETFEGNQFTDKKIEQYIVKQDISTTFPELDSNTALKTKITAEVVTDHGTYTLTRPSNWGGTNVPSINKVWETEDYMLYKRVYTKYDSRVENICFAYNSSLDKYVIAVVHEDRVEISLDNGATYKVYITPATIDTRYSSDICDLTEDGRHFIMVCQSGAYTLSVGSEGSNWTKISFASGVTFTGNVGNAYHFYNVENFCWASLFWPEESDTPTYEIYGKTVGFGNDTNIIKIDSFTVNKDVEGYIEYAVPGYWADLSIVRPMRMTYGNNHSAIVLFLAFRENRTEYPNGDTPVKKYPRARVIFNSSTKKTMSLSKGRSYVGVNSLALEESDTLNIDFNYCTTNWTTSGTIEETGTYYSNCIKKIKTSDTTISITNSTTVLSEQYYNFGGDDLIKVNSNMYFIGDSGGARFMYSPTATSSKFTEYILPAINDENIDATPSGYSRCFKKMVANNKYMFVSYYLDYRYSDWYTNLWAKDDIATVSYQYNQTAEYTQIPDITYSDSELFLTFTNTLMITKNNKDGENILFNLPKINNQSFGNDIKAIINISTTELAIFFENGITICSKASDELTGYRYDYAKTRLTLGTKFGDSVINTADGASTLYATPRGLAIMNYQAYMATTDQTLQFVSDKIYAIWNKFYLNSENITLVQHGDYVFVYNTSNQYLMLDLRNYSWWKFEIPFNIKKIITDQIDLRVISDKLYKFKQVNNNTDKIEDDYVDNQYYDVDNEPIRWMFMSQRLHFNLPNHYKNMKQLVFHLVQSTGHISTFNAQIKLYRNSVNYKDMEVIPFDFNFAVDEFRTFVKRFNYWKINMLQYGVANDDKAAVPARLVCNGIDIKYEIGDEVR